MSWPSSTTARNTASSRGISGPYSALTSTSGIVCTRRHSSCGHTTVDQIGQRKHDARHDRVFDVPKVVLEALVARPEAVADPDEGERPQSRSHERQSEEGRE